MYPLHNNLEMVNGSVNLGKYGWSKISVKEIYRFAHTVKINNLPQIVLLFPQATETMAISTGDECFSSSTPLQRRAFCVRVLDFILLFV